MTEADNTGQHAAMATPVQTPLAIVTHAEMADLSRTIVTRVIGAGIIGLALMAGASYMQLHDVRRDVADVRADHVADMTRSRRDVERRHAEHGTHGHRDVLDALRSIDTRLGVIEQRLSNIEE